MARRINTYYLMLTILGLLLISLHEIWLLFLPTDFDTSTWHPISTMYPINPLTMWFAGLEWVNSLDFAYQRCWLRSLDCWPHACSASLRELIYFNRCVGSWRSESKWSKHPYSRSVWSDGWESTGKRLAFSCPRTTSYGTISVRLVLQNRRTKAL